MPRTKPKPQIPASSPSNGLALPLAEAEVLTLAETAAYLRISEADVLRMVKEQGLSGRGIGNEWRFLKAALRHWLASSPLKSSKEAVLERIGHWENDPHLGEELREIYQRRGRPMTEDES